MATPSTKPWKLGVDHAMADGIITPRRGSLAQGVLGPACPGQRHRRLRRNDPPLQGIQHLLQIIPRRRSDNALEQLAWTVANLDRLAGEQRRSNIEIWDRIRELQILREEPPVRWHAQMERMQPEVRAQIQQRREMLALADDPAKAALYTQERIDREPDQEDVPGRSRTDLCPRLRPVVRRALQPMGSISIYSK